MNVNKERVELFAQALESDQYQQCTAALRKRLPNETGTGMTQFHCVIGVGIAVALANGCKIPEYWGNPFDDFALPEFIQEWYGFDSHDPALSIDSEDLVYAGEKSDWTRGRRFISRDLDEHGTMLNANDTMILPFKIIAGILRRTYLEENS